MVQKISALDGRGIECHLLKRQKQEWKTIHRVVCKVQALDLVIALRCIFDSLGFKELNV